MNYSIAFGTLHCLPCSNNYLVLIIPFAIAGIVFVIVLLFLQLSVATGMVNGLIFYANVIQANRSIFFPPGNTNILTVFIAWLNLDLGIETCFFDEYLCFSMASILVSLLCLVSDRTDYCSELSLEQTFKKLRKESHCCFGHSYLALLLQAASHDDSSAII